MERRPVATGVANGSALDHMRDNVRGIFDKHGIAEIRCDAIAGLIWQIRRERAPAERDRKRKREAMISRTIEQMKKIVSEQKKSIEAAIGENGDLATMFNYPNWTDLAIRCSTQRIFSCRKTILSMVRMSEASGTARRGFLHNSLFMPFGPGFRFQMKWCSRSAWSEIFSSWRGSIRICRRSGPSLKRPIDNF
jgi:hypothetical protein